MSTLTIPSTPGEESSKYGKKKAAEAPDGYLGRWLLSCARCYLWRRRLWNFLVCAGLLWNFFANAVLQAPSESPCFWWAFHALRLILIVTCLILPAFVAA
jgi:hypothetical protein